MAIGFKHFHSGQGGAPILTGEVGSLIRLLDWALDIGDAAEGWEKIFVAANKAVYRPRHGVRYYFRVNDSAHLPGGARDAEVRCFESMDDVDTGTSGAPLISNWVAGSGTAPAWRKSDTATNTARAYYGIKTASWLLLWIRQNDSAAGGHLVFVGQVPSLHPAENYPWAMSWSGVSIVAAYGPIVPGAAGVTSSFLGGAGQMVDGRVANLQGMTATSCTSYVAAANTQSAWASFICWLRSPSGALKSVVGGMQSASWQSAASDGYKKLYSLSAGAEVRLVRAEALATESNSISALLYPRSYFPNLWTTAADLVEAGWSPGDRFTTSDRPGASFVYIGVAGTGAGVILEVTDTGGAV